MAGCASCGLFCSFRSQNLELVVRMCEHANMRTTIDLPDALFRKAKVVSSLRGTTLKEFITQAIEHELAGSPMRIETRRVEFPLVHSKRPGSVQVTPDRVASLLEREDIDVSREQGTTKFVGLHGAVTVISGGQSAWKCRRL